LRIRVASPAADGTARAHLDYTDANANRGGAVHGGAIASLLATVAELAAAASERQSRDVELRTATAAISFLDAVRRGDDVVADARVLRRGRDTVHVVADASRVGGVPVATALFACTVLPSGAFDAPMQMSRAGAHVRATSGELAGSAYMGAAGARVIEADGGWSCMLLPRERNQARPGRVHDGDAGGRGRRGVDVVEAGAAPADHSHVG